MAVLPHECSESRLTAHAEAVPRMPLTILRSCSRYANCQGGQKELRKPLPRRSGDRLYGRTDNRRRGYLDGYATPFVLSCGKRDPGSKTVGMKSQNPGTSCVLPLNIIFKVASLNTVLLNFESAHRAVLARPGLAHATEEVGRGQLVARNPFRRVPTQPGLYF